MYPVDLHMHTVASTHAYSTIHDYVREASRKGMALIAITDHGPELADAPHYWHFMTKNIWPRVMDGVAILRGIEANIKNRAGAIDCTDEMCRRLDWIVAGFHESVYAPTDRATHTTAMINTIASGKVHMISHPGNPNYPVDIEAVVVAAAQHQVALELNNSSFEYSRNGSEPYCIAVAEAVKRAGGWLALGSDSHIANTVGDFTHCQRVIEQVNFPRERILNTSPRRLLDFLLQRGGTPITELAYL